MCVWCACRCVCAGVCAAVCVSVCMSVCVCLSVCCTSCQIYLTLMWWLTLSFRETLQLEEKTCKLTNEWMHNLRKQCYDFRDFSQFCFNCWSIVCCRKLLILYYHLRLTTAHLLLYKFEYPFICWRTECSSDAIVFSYFSFAELGLYESR